MGNYRVIQGQFGIKNVLVAKAITESPGINYGVLVSYCRIMSHFAEPPSNYLPVNWVMLNTSFRALTTVRQLWPFLNMPTACAVRLFKALFADCSFANK